jgi:hypothetical protein
MVLHVLLTAVKKESKDNGPQTKVRRSNPGASRKKEGSTRMANMNIRPQWVNLDTLRIVWIRRMKRLMVAQPND